MPFIGFGNQRQITSHFLIPMIIWTPCTWGRQCFIGTPCTLVRPFYWDTLNLGKTIFIGTPCTWEDQFYWDTLYLGMANFIGTPFTWGRPCLLGHPVARKAHVYWDTLYTWERQCLLAHPVYLGKTMFIGTPCITGEDNFIGTPCITGQGQVYWYTLYLGKKNIESVDEAKIRTRTRMKKVVKIQTIRILELSSRLPGSEHLNNFTS